MATVKVDYIENNNDSELAITLGALRGGGFEIIDVIKNVEGLYLNKNNSGRASKVNDNICTVIISKRVQR